MSAVLAVFGPSGSGKTTSMRNLDPESTLYIDADKKGLSWCGWRKQYSGANYNYLSSSNSQDIIKALDYANTTPRFKVVVIDTANAIMLDDEMARMQQKGYDKWQDLAMTIYGLIDFTRSMRDDLVIVWVFHSESFFDEDGVRTTRFLTSGRKLQKIQLETKFPTVLYSIRKNDKYKFETQAIKSIAKSPMGMLELEEDNDMVEIIKKLRAYEAGE